MRAIARYRGSRTSAGPGSRTGSSERRRRRGTGTMRNEARGAMTGALVRTMAMAMAMAAGCLWSTALDAQTLAERAASRLARLDGTVTLPALDSAVEVRRDGWGVPHIYAKTQHDLFFAQGYVVAQDRLFQMEMWRRMGEGRLAEVLGPSAVGRDRIARLLAYRGDWNAEYASYSNDTRAILDAFTDGVNAYV